MAAKIVGRGVFATVNLEMHNHTERAVKVYEHKVGAPGSDAQKMQDLHLTNEVRLAGRLSHPHIIAPLEVRVGSARTELTMEYAPHGTLEAYVLRLGPLGLPEAEGRRLFSQLVSAVAYLHAQGVAHRDIKLENAMLDAQWRVRLIDFGSSHDLKANGSTAGGGGGSPADRLHLMQGTPGYMSPEVLHGAIANRGGYNLRLADMWSLGVCLYCLFNETGLPFKAKDAKELHRVASSKPPPELLHLSRHGTDLLEMLLSKHPADRPTAAAGACDLSPCTSRHTASPCISLHLPALDRSVSHLHLTCCAIPSARVGS